MYSETPTAEALRPAPLDRVERQNAATAVLREHGIFARRLGHADSPREEGQAGITITYLHLSQAADGRDAVHLLAERLDWDRTDIAVVAGSVAITTRHG